MKPVLTVLATLAASICVAVLIASVVAQLGAREQQRIEYLQANCEFLERAYWTDGWFPEKHYIYECPEGRIVDVSQWDHLTLGGRR